nr:KOW domain-containing RNA-binding protein [uncultured Catonella sp.]
MELKSGMLAISKAGHDKGELYVVNSIEEKFAFLINGKKYTKLHSKKKNLLHIQPINIDYKDVIINAGKQHKRESFNNEDIAFAIKLYKREMVADTGKETNV